MPPTRLTIESNTGRIIIEVSPKFYRPLDVNFLLGDSSKAKRELNWHPKVNFNELIEFIDAELSLISTYLQELSLPFGDPKPIWKKTGIKFIDNVIEILKVNIGDLSDLNFFLILEIGVYPISLLRCTNE